jgi:hypothetical protein
MSGDARPGATPLASMVADLDDHLHDLWAHPLWY